MAVCSTDDDVVKFLKALGMPEGCTRFELVAECNQPVRAVATFYPSWPPADGEELITRRFKLVEED